MPNVHPPPTDLYMLSDLVGGFDPTNYRSILQTRSFHQYQAYYPIKVSGISDLSRIRKISDYDARVSEALYRYLKATQRRPVGIMGSHSLSRAEKSYGEIAHLARELTRAGLLVVTGGGPGAMEAAHVGAFFANGSDADLSSTLSDLAASSQAAIPKPSPGAKLLNDDGTLATAGDDVYTRALFSWYLDADTLRHRYAGQPGGSLAVSTWEYGEEPVMPFATAYAAYFQNSIREERILREARAGSIYARGGGGTLREIFQDVEENYYARKTEDFTPMIFFDSSHYWDPPLSTTNPPPTPSTIKLDDVIDRVFERALPQTSGVDWKSKRLFSTNELAILSLLTSYAAETQSDFLMLLSRIG